MCAMLFHDNWQALHEQHTHRPTQTEQCCNPLLSIKLSNFGFSLLHAGWRNVVFRWGFNSLFTAALLGQNSFLEANVNQSNLMSAQQGLSSPTVWVSRIFVPPLREKKDSGDYITSIIPWVPARHHTINPVLLGLSHNKAQTCYCCLLSTLLIDLHEAL